jgi:AcrR family transcriptional regulator
VEEATEVLAVHGLVAVAVEPISERLGVTKGSFYAHFSSRDELVAAVLQRWKELDTEQVIACTGLIPDPRERLARFLEFGFERHHWGRVFAALCATASDPRVDPVMRAVREARMTYLERALRDLGLARQQAHDRATLIYASYVGFWRLVAADAAWEYNDPRPLHRLAAHIKNTLIPPVEEHSGHLGQPSPLDA